MNNMHETVETDLLLEALSHYREYLRDTNIRTGPGTTKNDSELESVGEAVDCLKRFSNYTRVEITGYVYNPDGT